jgi:general secretion pathway protein C
MRLSLDPRARRLLRRVPRTNVYTLLELALLSLLAIQCARLVWTLAAPVGPVGDWKVEGGPAAPAGLLGGFDPFFRLGGTGGPVTVTSLNLKLHGIRQDQASGRGSAIIATPDGRQRSFAVGEEVVPGVTLAEVGFDSVTLSRGGAAEQLFMDQSSEAAVVAPGAPSAPAPPSARAPPPPVVAPAPSAADLAAGIRLQPRMNGSRVTGVILHPQGSGEAFRAAGFAPGDVLLSVDGARISSPDQLRTLAQQLAGAATVQIERGGEVTSLQLGSRR